MILRVADRSLQTSANEVVVATDHADIAAIVTEAGYHAHMTLAEHPSGTDRIAQVAMERGWSELDSRSPMQLQNERAGVHLKASVDEVRSMLARG